MEKQISFNFGAIRDTIVRLSTAEILKEQKSLTLSKFVKEIKEKPIFKKQQLIYKNIEECKPFDKERLAERFLSQNLYIIQNENWNEIFHENKRIRKELLDEIHVEAKDYGGLFESINILIEAKTNHGFTSFSKEQSAYDHIIKHLTREVKNESDKSVEKEVGPNILKETWKYISEYAVSNFKKRYIHLNEEEQKVFKILISDTKTKENYLEDLKGNNLNIIANKLNENKNDKSICEALESFKIKIENMKNVNYVDIDKHIIACIELKENLTK